MADEVKKIVYGVSTSVVFDMSEADRIFKQSKEAYIEYMIEHADDPLPLGVGFEHIQAAAMLPEHIDIVIMSRNSPLTARRALKTLEIHHRECFLPMVLLPFLI